MPQSSVSQIFLDLAVSVWTVLFLSDFLHLIRHYMLENGWRDGPIYVLEILLYDPDGYYETNEPRVEMAKFEYEDIKHFSPGVSAASYYYFADPLYDVDYEEIEDEILVAEMPEEMTQKYWGVKRVVCKVSLLVDIDYENAYDVIFGTFKTLKDK